MAKAGVRAGAGLLSPAQYARNTINAAQSLVNPAGPGTDNDELREDGGLELREDGGVELRE